MYFNLSSLLWYSLSSYTRVVPRVPRFNNMVYTVVYSAIQLVRPREYVRVLFFSASLRGIAIASLRHARPSLKYVYVHQLLGLNSIFFLTDIPVKNNFSKINLIKINVDQCIDIMHVTNNQSINYNHVTFKLPYLSKYFSRLSNISIRSVMFFVSNK